MHAIVHQRDGTIRFLGLDDLLEGQQLCCRELLLFLQRAGDYASLGLFTSSGIQIKTCEACSKSALDKDFRIGSGLQIRVRFQSRVRRFLYNECEWRSPQQQSALFVFFRRKRRWRDNLRREGSRSFRRFPQPPPINTKIGVQIKCSHRPAKNHSIVTNRH